MTGLPAAAHAVKHLHNQTASTHLSIQVLSALSFSTEVLVDSVVKVLTRPCSISAIGSPQVLPSSTIYCFPSALWVQFGFVVRILEPFLRRCRVECFPAHEHPRLSGSQVLRPSLSQVLARRFGQSPPVTSTEQRGLVAGWPRQRRSPEREGNRISYD